MSYLSLLTLCSVIGVAASTFSMTGYACNQPQVYQQCQCPNICSGYMQQQGYMQPQGYMQQSQDQAYQYPNYYYNTDYAKYQEFVRKHRPRHHHHKIRHHKHKHRPHHQEELPPSTEDLNLEEINSDEIKFKSTRRPTTTERPIVTTTRATWDDEDKWQSKFVSKNRHQELSSEEFPTIDSDEINIRTRPLENSHRELETQSIASPPSPAAPSNFGGSSMPSSLGGNPGGIGIGGGVGVGPVGVSTGLGIGAPGIGGLGNGGVGGGGNIFGIGSGLGIGVPGVGPIGISSGIGVGK